MICWSWWFSYNFIFFQSLVVITTPGFDQGSVLNQYFIDFLILFLSKFDPACPTTLSLEWSVEFDDFPKLCPDHFLLFDLFSFAFFFSKVVNNPRGVHSWAWKYLNDFLCSFYCLRTVLLDNSSTCQIQMASLY